MLVAACESAMREGGSLGVGTLANVAVSGTVGEGVAALAVDDGYLTCAMV